MKIKYIILILALTLASCNNHHNATPCRLAESGVVIPKDVKLLGHTPAADQGLSDFGWIYGMLATMEIQHIGQGDSIHLSAAYLARMVLRERTADCYRSHGLNTPDTYGQPECVPLLLEKYGLVPYDSYPDPLHINYGVVCRKLTRLCDNALAKHHTLSWLLSQTDQLLDSEMGILPAPIVHLYRAEYTRQEFARSVCTPDEYQVLQSGHGFRPDNLLSFIKKQMASSRPVCWAGDEATGCHVTPIIGCFSQQGTTFLVIKDSHGKHIGTQGLLALPATYLIRHTQALLYAK